MIGFCDKRVPTILIVDDAKSDLLFLSKLLADYDILTADNGPLAIEIATKKLPDIILLDVVMSDMDGYEVCSILKNNKNTKDIPVIFATGNMNEGSIEKAYSVGGVDYVTKPFKSKELLARIKIQLAYNNVQKELEEKIKLIDKNVSYSTTDTKGIITEASEAFCKIAGYTKEELIGKNHNILRHPEADKEVYTELWRTIKKGDIWRGELKNRNKNGVSYWADIIITPVLDNNKIIAYTAIRNDSTARKKVEILSITDQLTNLYNRRHFNNSLPVEIKRCMRQDSCLSFVMVDVDFFKQYNDTYGHQEGDNVLARLGELLQQELYRAGDLIFRLGGEEFGLIYTTNNSDASIEMAQRVRKAVVKLNIEHKMSKDFNCITVSLGVVCVDFSKKSNMSLEDDQLYKLADDELYKAKKSGRNMVSALIM